MDPILTDRQRERLKLLGAKYSGFVLSHLKNLRTLNDPMSLGEAIDRWFEIELAHGDI